MSTEFEIIFEDFSLELDALVELVNQPNNTNNTTRSRIAAGNAATLLLAAMFEEFVRQEVKSAFIEKGSRAGNSNPFPENLFSKIWKKSLEKLARTQFEDVESNLILMETRLASIISFALRKDFLADVSEAVAHNEHNMRPTQLNLLFKQIGISNITLNACKSADLMQFTGCTTPETARTALEARMDDFFRRRNNIAHAITLASSSAPLEILQDIELFRIYGQTLGQTLAMEFPPLPVTPTE